MKTFHRIADFFNYRDTIESDCVIINNVLYLDGVEVAQYIKKIASH